MPDQKPMWTRCLGWFSVMWVTKLLISPVKKKDFWPKNDQIWPKIDFLFNLGQAMQAYSVPCWWVSWWLWRAGCISQDTYLLYLARRNVTIKGHGKVTGQRRTEKANKFPLRIFQLIPDKCDYFQERIWIHPKQNWRKGGWFCQCHDQWSMIAMIIDNSASAMAY